MSADLTFRSFASHADYQACGELQCATWGEDFRELVPPAMLMITLKVGGVAAGAFDGDRLVGFVYGLTGWKAGRPVHWSHMLAVAETHRDRGIGRRLKEYQRDQLRANGVETMSWTFDPLVARNAHLNIDRLGARIAEYVVGMYGDDPRSAMDSVIGTDRFVAEWDLTAPPRPHPGGKTEGRKDGPEYQVPAVSLETTDLPDGPQIRILVPEDIQELKRYDPDEAQAWRAITRRAFQHYLNAGYQITTVGRSPTTARSWYVLVRD